MTTTVDDTVTKMSLYLSFVVLLGVFITCCGKINETPSCYQLGTQENAKGQSMWKKDTLQCKCLPHVVGLNCDKCKDGYYNIQSGQGCISCQCNPEGSQANSTCDAQGKCKCKKGYTGYRCDRRVIETSPCICTTLLENSTDTLRAEIYKINTTIHTLLVSHVNSSDFEKFNKRLDLLKESVQNLQSQFDDTFDSNYHNQIAANINNIREQVTSLITSLLQQNTTDIANITLYYQHVFNISEDCTQTLADAKNLSNGMIQNKEMTTLSKEAKQIVKELTKLALLLTEIENYYKSAEQSTKDLSESITKVQNTYLENIRNVSVVKNLLNSTSINSAKSKKIATLNRERLDNILLPLHNKSIFCAQEIPELKNDLEDHLHSRFENCYQQQTILEELSNKLKKAEHKTVRLEKQNEEDNILLKTIYKNALDVINEIDEKMVLTLLDISDINEENEDRLLFLQEELEHLIQKLEMFTNQLNELEMLTNENYDFLENLEKQLNESKENYEKVKELDSIIGTVPITNEELNNIEDEINKGNEYFLLLQQVKKMEEEVNIIETIAIQLNSLPEDLCSANVHPEGVTLLPT